MVEIHSGEGGEDSKLFLYDLLSAYSKYAKRNGLDAEILTSEPSLVVLSIRGRNAFEVFKSESGKHCLQRIPPTERHGRVHTSIVSVAVLPILQKKEQLVKESDVEIQLTKGSGPGGQARNKIESAVRMIHKPTGLKVFICCERSQHQNRAMAWSILSAKVRQQEGAKTQSAYDENRLHQVGNRGRSDKVRTYNFKDKRATDHRTGRKTTQVEMVMDGRFDLLR